MESIGERHDGNETTALTFVSQPQYRVRFRLHNVIRVLAEDDARLEANSELTVAKAKQAKGRQLPWRRTGLHARHWRSSTRVIDLWGNGVPRRPAPGAPGTSEWREGNSSPGFPLCMAKNQRLVVVLSVAGEAHHVRLPGE